MIIKHTHIISPLAGIMGVIMPVSASNPHAADSLIGQIVDAEIMYTHFDYCDLRLLDEQRVRLYQHDSLAAKNPILIKDLAEYQAPNVIKIMITHKRTEGRGTLYYANERWAMQNPWENLTLNYGDRVQGTVLHLVHNEQNVLRGYLLQLDTTLPINLNPSHPLQPDILVYLPLEELPHLAEGIEVSANINTKHLLLERGETTQVIITELHQLPRYPKGSLIRAIQQQDENFWSDSNRLSHIALFKERLHQHKLSAAGNLTSEYTLLESKLPDKPLAAQRILLVDDREDSLKQLQKALVNQGAEVSTLLLNPEHSIGLWEFRLQNRLKEFNPTLVLIDNALPEVGDGMLLAARLLAKQSAEPSHSFICALISSLFTTEQIKLIQQQVPLLRGALLRPVELHQLLALCQGESVWEQTNANLYEEQGLDNPPLDLPHYFAQLVRQKLVDSIVVLNLEQGQVTWEQDEGILPFSASDVVRIAQESELRLLINKLQSQLVVDRHSVHENCLIGGRLREAYWFRISIYQGRLEKIIGLSWLSQGHKALAELLYQNIQDKYRNHIWYQWAQHNANFINAGVTIHSLVHEYRYYLNQISPAIEALEKAHEQNSAEYDEVSRATLNNLSVSVKDMSLLTDYLLKSQAERIETVAIEEILVKTESLLRPIAQENKVDFRIFNSSKMMLGIPAASITTPLYNLILNAFKHHYRKSNRKVSVVTQLRQIEARYWLDFQVRDNGIGIAAHQLPHLFQPGISFARQNDERHGIGLWLARTMARRVGGDIELCQNLKGLGVCFSLKLPIVLG